jgi:hypothetical protein
MKRLAQFLLILSSISYAYDDPTITNTINNRGKHGCCNTTICCSKDQGCKGPQGHRGKKGNTGNTGPIGATGATGVATTCGLNELFANAALIFGNVTNNVNIEAACPYNIITNACMPAWPFIPSSSSLPFPLGFNFDIPIDLDNTQPVTLVVHFLIENSEGQATGDQVNFQVDADYKANGEVITGFAETVMSGDFTVSEPAIPGNFNLISRSISLNPALMAPNDWAFLSFRRIAPASNEYSLPILLTAVSFQYSKICS